MIFSRTTTSVSNILVTLFLLTACSTPQPGPDKTAAGFVLGAGWGAGAGAVVGNQISYAGEGAAVGAGFGAVNGALTGAGFDVAEGIQIDQEEALASLKIQNEANGRELEVIQARLDDALAKGSVGGMYQVFFDPDSTSLKSGSIANLESIGDSIKTNPGAVYVNVVGHSDDAGTPEYNSQLAEARARSVTSYLAARGISMNRIKVSSYGATRPIASNSTPTGRQLNRRVDVYITR